MGDVGLYSADRGGDSSAGCAMFVDIRVMMYGDSSAASVMSFDSLSKMGDDSIVG